MVTMTFFTTAGIIFVILYWLWPKYEVKMVKELENGQFLVDVIKKSGWRKTEVRYRGNANLTVWRGDPGGELAEHDMEGMLPDFVRGAQFNGTIVKEETKSRD